MSVHFSVSLISQKGKYCCSYKGGKHVTHGYKSALIICEETTYRAVFLPFFAVIVYSVLETCKSLLFCCFSVPQTKFKKSQKQLNVFTNLPVTSTQIQPIKANQQGASKGAAKLNCCQCSHAITSKPELIQIEVICLWSMLIKMNVQSVDCMSLN